MGYGKNKAKSKKYKSQVKQAGVKDVKNTSCAKKARGTAMPMTKMFVDVESSIKKDKEVKEKDVFDFKYKPSKN